MLHKKGNWLKVYTSNNNIVVVIIVIVSMVIRSTSTATTTTKVTDGLPTTMTPATTTNIETETDVLHSKLEVEVDEEAQAILKRVPSALSLSRRSSILLQRTSSMMLRKRGKKKKSGNFHYRSWPDVIEKIDADEQDGSSKAKPSTSSSPKRLTPWINYEVFQWAWFLTLCILAIANRFT